MKLEDLTLIGLDTREAVDLGTGHRTWPLTHHRGPQFNASRVSTGGPSRPYLVLPKDLLELFYSRFAYANPSGCAVSAVDEMDTHLYLAGTPEEERRRLWDAGEVGWEGFDWRIPPHGRDPIRRYLPELFEPTVLQRILDDPRLDMSRKAPRAPANYEDYWQDRSRHYRWSDWWNER